MTDHDDEAPKPRYNSLMDWMHNWFGACIQRRLEQSEVWCPEWWRHPEAISRLEAMWRSWEAMRLDGTLGMAQWWRDICDYHLDRLASQNGPFGDCRSTHSDGEKLYLPLVTPEPGWFGDDQASGWS